MKRKAPCRGRNPRLENRETRGTVDAVQVVVDEVLGAVIVEIVCGLLDVTGVVPPLASQVSKTARPGAPGM